MVRRKLSLSELGRPSLDTYKSLEKIPVILVLDNIRSGLNVGSLFRSADAFAIEKIVLGGITPVPPHKEITKSAIGATESVEWEYKEDLESHVAKAKSEGYKVICVEQTSDAVPLTEFKVDSSDKYLIVMGNEVSGVGEGLIAMADECVEINQYGTKHSLNVAVCGGIVLWHFSHMIK